MPFSKIASAVLQARFKEFVDGGTDEAEEQENKNHADDNIEKFGTKHGWGPPKTKMPS